MLTAKVAQVLDGGLCVNVDETRVFIPASLVSDTYEKDLTKYAGQEIEFVITEFNPKRRRIFGDRKQLLVAKKLEQQKELFAKIKVGDVIQVRKPPVTYSFRVLALSENRMGAKLVPGYLENITPPEQYELLEMVRIGGFVNRQKGLGRPTKRDGRQMKQFLESEYADDGFDFDFDFEDDDLDE